MLKTSPSEMGRPAKSFRMGLGALIIKEKLGISDRPRVEHIAILNDFLYLEQS